jgi:hypothetical protein
MNLEQEDRSKRQLLPIDFVVACVLGVSALIVYLLTLTPSLSYLSPDGSELATIPAVLGLAHSPGYPLYTWLGYLFHFLPINDVAYRINLMSAVMGAVTIGCMYLLALRLLPLQNPWGKEQSSRPTLFEIIVKRAIVGLGVMLFAFSTTFWSQAVIAEVYVPNAAMILLTLFALLQWEKTRRVRDFFLFAFVFGLSLGTHISNLGFALGFAAFVLLTDWRVIKNWKWWLAALAGFLLGVAQFAWLPFKAGTLNDQMMLARAPIDLKGIYNYTLGAFPQFKFAFTLAELPDRLILYLYMLVQELGWLPLVAGIIGLFSLLFRRTRYFFLLVGMYLVQIWFFIQYSAFDLEVFFIPAHLLWSIFDIFGFLEVFALVRWVGLKARTPKPAPQQKPIIQILAGILCCVVLLAPTLLPLIKNWSVNDFSQDTAINDFYANIWELLPRNSALLTQSGVFGYDAFYWRLIYNMRPDVLLPALTTPNPKTNELKGHDLFTTTRLNAQRGPGALPGNLISDQTWSIPVLLGESPQGEIRERGSLVLYRVSNDPPDLLADEQPQIQIDQNVNDYVLKGVTFSSTTAENGGSVEVWMYWKLPETQGALPRTLVTTYLGDRLLESHQIGLGLLERYQQDIGLQTGSVIVDHFYLVIPSTIETGNWALSLGITETKAQITRQITLENITILNSTGQVTGWLEIAGN